MSELELPIAPCDTDARYCGTACGSVCREGSVCRADSESQADASGLIAAPDQVLSTLTKDGTRNWLKPRISIGPWFRRRQALAYVLMIVFIAVPHIRMFGKPLIQLDIINRKFTLFGTTFLPTDTLLLALLMLTAFVSIVFLTTVMGRAWCGWGCPQTVYIEYLFRPLDRLFEGTVGKGGKARRPMGPGMQALRFLCYVLITSVLAHTFLAYFVGTEQLSQWLWGSPFNHPVAFAVMITTTGLLTYDFYYFREQTCMIACPYGRFQSVMLDRQSLIVAYDAGRGEPRRKGKRKNGVNADAGDCVDCNRCVDVCPTGIDIRDGLQMECINCTQCIDACDDVMTKVGLPTGLVRYTSQEALAGRPWRLLRPRTLIYPVVLVALIGGFLFAASTKYGFDARIVRGKGAPFTVQAGKSVSNSFSLRLVNRTEESQTYEVRVLEPQSATVEVIDPEDMQLSANKSALVPVQIVFPTSLTQGAGNAPITLEIEDKAGNQRQLEFRLLGPR